MRAIVPTFALIAAMTLGRDAHADPPYVGVSAGYEVLAIAPKNWANGLVGTVRIATHDERLSLTALVDYRVGIFIDSLPNGLRVDIGAFRLMGAMRIVKRGPLVVEGALGAGFDLMRIETRPTVGPVSTPTVPMLRASLSERFRVWRSLDLVVSAVVEIDPTGMNYVTEVDGLPVTVLSPWTVRPGFMLELAAP
jgi:hypothetical protein